MKIHVQTWAPLFREIYASKLRAAHTCFFECEDFLVGGYEILAIDLSQEIAAQHLSLKMCEFFNFAYFKDRKLSES